MRSQGALRSSISTTLLSLIIWWSHQASAIPLKAVPVISTPSLIGNDSEADDSSSSSNNNQPTIVSNFQDLSALLSLLAADTVERKLCDPTTSDWERMSSCWSLFGIMGAIRTYMQIMVGLTGAEAAGLDLHGSGAFSRKRTAGSRAGWKVGSAKMSSWNNDTGLLRGRMSHVKSPWKRPIVVAMGHSQCPFTGKRKYREIFGRTSWIIGTALIACSPVLALRGFSKGTTIGNLTLGFLFLSGILGSIVPILIDRWNPTGIPHLNTLLSGRPRNSGPLLDGDVITATDAEIMIAWNVNDSTGGTGSADMISIRILAGFTTLILLTTYLLNYFLLGEVPTTRTYIWLGVESVILAVRYTLWAARLRSLSNRRMLAIFAVLGSLTEPLPVVKHTSVSDARPSDGDLQLSIVKFAHASASSKIQTKGVAPARLQLDPLRRLADVIPRDFLLAPYCDVSKLDKDESNEYRAVRLPWSFVEEVYIAQGLVLGANPWALGGLYLAAIISGNEFIGLTTIHPPERMTSDTLEDGEDVDTSVEDSAASQGGNVALTPIEPQATAHRSEPEPEPEPEINLFDITGLAGVTLEGYAVDSLVDGVLGDRVLIKEEWSQWHMTFRENVRRCRSTAVSNGPPHCEVRVDGVSRDDHVIDSAMRTVDTFSHAANSTYLAASHSIKKDHAKCGEVCNIYGFEY